MVNQEVIEAIRYITDKEPTENDLLKDDLKMDALQVVEVVMTLESKLCIDIHDSEVEKCKTVKDLIEVAEDSM